MFLQDMADFPKVNPIYEAGFDGHKPARSTIQVAKLPLGALVEIEVIAEYGTKLVIRDTVSRRPRRAPCPALPSASPRRHRGVCSHRPLP